MTLLKRQPYRVRAHQFPRGAYPSTTRGIAKYLYETYGDRFNLKRDDYTELVRAVFHFIKQSVLVAGHELPVYRFGTFRRFWVTRDTVSSLGAETPSHWRLKFMASQHHGHLYPEQAE